MNSDRIAQRGWVSFLLVCLLFQGKALGQLATSAFRTGAAPAWAESAGHEQPATNAEQEAGGQVFNLFDTQVNVGREQTYLHFIKEITSATGVQSGANLQFSWDPSYQQLTIHRIIVHRDGTDMDRLDVSRFKVFQQETDLSRQIYNGTLFAVLFLEDVRVGDRIEFDYTITGENPSLKGKFSDSFLLGWPTSIRHRRVRLLCPDERKLQFSLHGTGAQPSIQHREGQTEYLWDLHDLPAVVVEDQIPTWFAPYPWVQVSEYKNWSEVAAWAEELFATTNLDAPELAQLTSDLRRPGLSAEQTIQHAMEFVQNQVRYLGIEIGPSSYRPSDPARVLRQRFGDCKDKALLLSVLLRKLGYQATPMLVATGMRQTLVDMAPAPHLFNHAIVQVTANERTYWLDPTRAYQRGSITLFHNPPYGYGLLASAKETGLSPIPMPDAHDSYSETLETFHVRGQKQPASLSVTVTLTGEDAESIRAVLASEGLDRMEKIYLNDYARFYPGIKVAEPMVIVDSTNLNTLKLIQSYSISNFWVLAADKQKYSCEFYPQAIHYWITKPGTTVRQMPMELAFPKNRSVRTKVELPRDFKLTSVTNIITGPAVQLRIERIADAQTVWINYHYRALTNFVPASLTASHLDSLKRMEESLGYALWWQNLEGSTAKGQLNWSILLLAITYTGAFAGGAGFFCYKQCGKPLDPAEAPPLLDQHLNGLGGWLILIGLALIINPIRLMALGSKSLGVFSAWKWGALTTPGAVSYNALWAPLLTFELLGQISLILMMLIGLILFFQKRRIFPRWYIAILVANLVFVIADQVGMHLLGSSAPAASAQTAARQFMAAIVGCFIWIPYMLVSRRVKATFTR